MFIITYNLGLSQEDTMSQTIRIDEDVYGALQAQAVPFVDTPNSVLRRLLGLASSEEGPEGSEAPGFTTGTDDAGEEFSRHASRKKKRRKTSRKRVPTGTILREEEYELPMLTLLRDLGGSAPASAVIDELGKRLDGRLMPNDHERLSSGRIRWQNRAQFVRLRLVEKGDMERESPRGIWEISRQGRERLVKEHE
jgi:hypothetical protein